MTEPAERPGQQPAASNLAVVEPTMSDHVLDLLHTAQVRAIAVRLDEARVLIRVPLADLPRAIGTLDLVLPGLREGRYGRPGAGSASAEGGSGLSSRLVRSTPPAPDGNPRDWIPPDDVDEDEDDFVPPRPPPLPRPDAVGRFAWAAVIAGPVLLILTMLLGLDSLFAAAGLAAFIIGFGVLVARKSDEPRSPDGGDNGAVI